MVAQKKRVATRRDRPEKPHSRLADFIYDEMSDFTSHEGWLYIALLTRAWRRDGPNRGKVRKSLKRIARDIGMPWSTARKAMGGLVNKGFAERKGVDIKVLRFFSPSEEGHTMPPPGAHHAPKGAHHAPKQHLTRRRGNELGMGETFLRDGARAKRARAQVDTLKGSDHRGSRESARASAHGSRALSADAGQDEPTTPADDAAMSRKILSDILAASDQGLKALDGNREKRRADRREELRQRFHGETP